MKRMIFAGASLILALATALPCAGAETGTLADFEKAENALVQAWQHLPYGVRHAMFVAQPAGLYGGYQQRPSSVFAPGEKLYTYVEPIGYGWKMLDGGLLSFGVTTDFELLTAGGKVLGGQRAFQNVDLKSHYRNREFFVSLTLSVDGLKPGDYILAYTLHDNVSGQSARFEQPFTIKAGS